MQVKEILALATKKLIAQHIDFASLEAEFLLSEIFQKDRAYLLAHSEIIIPKTILKKFDLALNKRLQNIPLAYIVGHQEFYGLDFKVNKHTLIPRPETETLIDLALNYAPKFKPQTIIDLGTGPGTIAITLATKISGNFIATDISKPALKIAKLNAKHHRVKIKFFQGNLLAPIKKITEPVLLLANLPYLTKDQIKKSPSIKYEPKLALDGGPNGLKYYRELAGQIKKMNLQKLILIGEIDPKQGQQIKKLFGPQTLIKKDLCGRNRFFIFNKQK